MISSQPYLFCTDACTTILILIGIWKLKRPHLLQSNTKQISHKYIIITLNLSIKQTKIMPSGPKKRKKAAAAAKKKEEEEETGINHPPSSLQPQDKELAHKAQMESSEESHHEVKDVEIVFVQSKEEEACVCERPNEILLEKMSGEASTSEDSVKDVGSEFVETKEVAEACICERPKEILLEKMSEEASTSENTVKDVGSEFVENKEVVEACVCERPNEILLEEMSEEASTSEDTDKDVGIWFVENNEVVEASDDSLHSGCEDGRELPNMGTVIDISVADPTNEEVTAPLLERRASIWNCCGLLDVFKGSQR